MIYRLSVYTVKVVFNKWGDTTPTETDVLVLADHRTDKYEIETIAKKKVELDDPSRYGVQALSSAYSHTVWGKKPTGR